MPALWIHVFVVILVKTSAREMTEMTIGKAGKNPGFSVPQVATIRVTLTKILQITLS